MAGRSHNLRLDSAGVRSVLNSPEVKAAVEAACESLKSAIEAQGVTVEGAAAKPLPVTVRIVTTDRVHGLVSLAHPAGLAVQAKYGTLTKAAGSTGLSVRSR